MTMTIVNPLIPNHAERVAKARATAHDDATWRTRFACSPSLQREFGDVETYVAFMRYDGDRSRRPRDQEAIQRAVAAPAVAPTTPQARAAHTDATLRERFRLSADLQREFGSPSAFLAYARTGVRPGGPTAHDLASEATLCTRFAMSPALQAEFGDVDAYMRFHRTGIRS